MRLCAYAPKPMTSSAKTEGRFNNDAFVYDPAKNEYTCPAGEALIWLFPALKRAWCADAPITFNAATVIAYKSFLTKRPVTRPSTTVDVNGLTGRAVRSILSLAHETRTQ